MAAQPKSIFRKFWSSLLYLTVVFTVCVVGYICYGWNFLDSVYMVVITMFAVEIDDSDSTSTRILWAR